MTLTDPIFDELNNRSDYKSFIVPQEGVEFSFEKVLFYKLLTRMGSLILKYNEEQEEFTWILFTPYALTTSTPVKDAVVGLSLFVRELNNLSKCTHKEWLEFLTQYVERQKREYLPIQREYIETNCVSKCLFSLYLELKDCFNFEEVEIKTRKKLIDDLGQVFYMNSIYQFSVGDIKSKKGYFLDALQSFLDKVYANPELDAKWTAHLERAR